jgi:hypothetical protein
VIETPRTLKQGDRGPAVEAAKRSVYSFLGDDWSWRQMVANPLMVRRYFGPLFVGRVKQAQKIMELRQTGVVGPWTWEALEAAGAIDLYSKHLLAIDEARNPSVVNPIPIGHSAYTGALHPTAGLPGNWALDWLASAGTPVVAVERAKIRKLSGRDPALGADQQIGIFGWSIHYETPAGYRYFSTHYGRRENLTVGQVVEAGERVGWIGLWPGDPGRSHVHLGVTSPFGERDAKKRIRSVRDAPKVRIG